MAYENDQTEFPLPGSNSSDRKSENHLPKYFRTEANSKFLSSTIDQLLKPGVAEKLSGYLGRKTAKSYVAGDNYIPDVSKQREDYQLEPAQIIKDDIGNVEYYKDYLDLVNQISNFQGTNNNHNRINEQEFYTWNPHINWDMFTNFREYYWLPAGPQTVTIPGEQKEITSTYTVTLQNNGDSYSYLFTPDGATPNPSLKLYRGVKYRFEINTPGLPLTFRTQRTLDDQFLLAEGISAQEVEDGVIELELNAGTPNEIFYVSNNDINLGGIIRVANITDATFIDVTSEIIGKKYYTTRDGWSLTNGMKVRFSGDVTPSQYANSEWYIEGVGDKITLVSDTDVEVSFPVGIDLEVPFDAEEGFDRLPYGEAVGYPKNKDYIVINRSSIDGNFWSRYNRWFHKEVIELSASINNQPADIDQTARANRPIIEFDAGLKLFEFGTISKPVVDLIDTITTDAFSNIEGKLGYNIDGVTVTQGMRILFTADPDPLVYGKVFQVEFINFKGSGTAGQISLKEVADTDPVKDENVLIISGEKYSGSIWYYNGEKWLQGQEKTAVNQAPLFDVYDSDGNSFSDSSVYDATTFKGTKIFSYKEGSGANDSVLGFPLSYRSIDNVGDILFNFDYNTDMVDYQVETQSQQVEVASGYLRKYSTRTDYIQEGAWIKANELSNQSVIIQYENDNTRTVYPINCFDKSAFIDDLEIKVFVNNKILRQGIDYQVLNTADKFKAITLEKSNIGDIIRIKCNSSTPKNDNGFYEIAPNLERNPLNANVQDFTLGEVSDHVSTIVENIPNFEGIFPGSTNLRDLPNQSIFGRKFIKHSSPLNLAMYHLLDKDANIVKSLRFARREYGKFKRQFLEIAETLGFEGPVKQHVDKILSEIVKDKTNKLPFYFSDMLPFGAAITTRITVEDPDAQFFALSQPFEYNKINTKAVSVYINNEQLLYKRDYEFNENGFLIITKEKTFNDVIEIYEYESTNGSYVPPTPTKLGLYPKFEPRIYTENSYQTPTQVIEGHDGSIIKAYGDFRDSLILELETRIFNNIKFDYDPNLFDINDFIKGSFRKQGLTRQVINKTMTTDFIQWLQLVNEDYTKNEYVETGNGFTYNYANMTGPGGTQLPGFWRGIYKEVFDTDRPHTHPWEMLGFSIKPNWWETVYGPAPYTNENLLLWEDLETGTIREPGKPFVFNQKYKRPGLKNFIPVDSNGELLDPSSANVPLKFENLKINSTYEFGDYAPVELAWRKSSEYPFALLTSFAVNQPAKLFASGFDRSRQVRNTIGHLVYAETGHHITLKDIVFPNTPDDDSEVLTLGLVNYIAGYMSSNVTSNFKIYNERLKKIKNSLACKLAGYTDKSKFKLILDSRTPVNKSNVFIPEENYQIILNTSSPIKTVNYSGVIIEKQPSGFIIRGYNNDNPQFSYYPTFKTSKDPIINVGGISEPYSQWEAGQLYREGTNVEYTDDYFKVVSTHTSTATFDNTKFVRLPELPLEGGKTAVFSKKFLTDDVSTLPYGSVLNTIQDVVDFLLGYGRWLEDQGFKFDYYDGEEKILSNWTNSAKEFLFWTTQNWKAGSVISLSPAAEQVKLETEYSVVDNVFDNFYGYSILRADGKKLVEEFTKTNRTDPNKFTMRPRNTIDGVYAINLPIVQKEHILLIDNFTVFGDVIYDQPTGYRQERIKVLGYRTDTWDGSLNIPGFIYDDAKVLEWKSWTDYPIGALVKYKEFYYTAKTKISGEQNFDRNKWSVLSEKPQSGLLTNFEYKTNQFADFYDLDSDNFDIEQQRFAQHLIGYQNREYLSNIINDDVSQYKFYQGMIQDKGTKNALVKLFDVLSAADKESLEFYEEWAIKEGQYGASDGFEEVEFRLDENKFKISPQPFELVTNNNNDSGDLIYRIKPFEVFKKPNNYNHKPIPVKENLQRTFTKDAGFVHQEDVTFILNNYDSILSLNVTDLRNEEYIWIGTEKQSWNVYQHVLSDFVINKIEGNSEAVAIGDPDQNQFKVSITTSFDDGSIKVGDIIGIYDIITTNRTSVNNSQIKSQTTNDVQGFFKVLEVGTDNLTIETTQTINDVVDCRGLLTRFESVRVSDLNSANVLTEKEINEGNLVWLDDDGTGNWAVLKNSQAYKFLQKTVSDTTSDIGYGKSIDADNRNTVLAVGSPNEDNGKVYIYTRGIDSQNWQYAQTLELDATFSDDEHKFGSSLGISADGDYLVVGSPEASNVKTKFRGNFENETNYQNGESVKYSDQLWEAVVDIKGAVEALPFTTFGSIAEVYQKNNVFFNEETFNSILTGNYPFENIQPPEDPVDHFLVRAPVDQYDATGPGDTVYFDWYRNSTVNLIDTGVLEREVFDGEYSSVINESVLESGLVIQKKIDAILYLSTYVNRPTLDAQVDGPSVFGYATNIYEYDGALSIYVEGSFGSWPTEGALYLESGEYVGQFTKRAPVETIDTSDDLGGYWLFNAPSTYYVTDVTDDTGKALAVYNIVPQGKSNIDARGGNIYDQNNPVTFESIPQWIQNGTGNSLNDFNSYIRNLSYQGTPGAGGLTNDPRFTDLFVVRAPKSVTDVVQAGDTVNLEIFQFPDADNNLIADLRTTGLTVEDTNKAHTLYDNWDGFINYTLKGSFEPRIGQFVRDSVTLATAQVVFYQRDGLNATVFIKNNTPGTLGNWQKGLEFGEASVIQMLGTAGDPDPIFAVTQELGDVRSVSIGNDSLGIGGLLVFQRTAGQFTEIPANEYVVGLEYLVYRDDTNFGIPTEPNIPSIQNFDWRPIYKIPADAEGYQIAGNNQGMFSVYERSLSSNYTKIGTFIVPEQEENLRLGSNIKIRKNKDLYKTFIGCQGEGNSTLPGRIYFYNYGTTPDGDFYNWELAKNKNYKGEFSPEKDYFIDDIIFLDGNFYKAVTNIAGNPDDPDDYRFAFDPLDWERIAYDGAGYTGIDYVGYIPNDTDFVPNSDSTFKLSQVGLEEFGTVFDVDERGEVLIVTAKYDSDNVNKVIVYRALNGNYLKYQEIDAFDTLEDFGDTISISADGTMLAIGSPSADENKEGLVYVYLQENGNFNLIQTLKSTNASRKEAFGSQIDFDGNTLFVSANKSYSDEITIFDQGKTTFDNEFTEFKNKIIGNGVIYVYDRVNNGLVFGQVIDYNNTEARLFGETIIARNNHIYTGMRDFVNTDNKVGAVLDYRRDSNNRVWTKHRTPNKLPDLEKIKKVFLYDNDKNEIITHLDYIDPIQGKIAGPAEQELRYKTPFDPASYNIGDNTVNVSSIDTWGTYQVGQLWWDLSTIKFFNPHQGSKTYSGNTWNKLFPGSSVDVYEWVETELTPGQWDALAATEEGQSLGVTGRSKYGDSVFVTKKVYDSIAQAFFPKNYFWVKNKTNVPDVEWRSISAIDVARFIEDPAAMKHEYITFTEDDAFILWNCNSFIKGKDTVLNIQYWTSSDKDSNIHNQYQILTEGLSTSKPTPDIERKWFDSLIGYDQQDRPVPNPELSPRQRYGMLDKPRQGWFINRIEALKQFIERTNSVLEKNLIVESRDISPLNALDDYPSEITRKYDLVVDTDIDLQFVGTARADRAELSLVIENGKIQRVDILNSGRGYKVVPTIEILGTGSGAEIELTINNIGQVTSATVLNSGNNYSNNARIIVRRFTVLVKSDSTIRGKWALYERIDETSSWNRISSQAYDVTSFWKYKDWYDTGYNEFTDINYVVDYSYNLQGLDDNLGDIVKINNIGSTGWILLEKIDEQQTVDYTVNYKTIGRQNGTIEFLPELYNLEGSQVGFDAQSYDTKFFDNQPVEEIRVVLNTLKNNILITDLEVEFNKLFFASLRYVFSEQGYVDWAFKTSFIKAQHNVGELKQKLTYQNDNLASYQDYLEEVKPYKTKLREYVSNYNNIENSSSILTDFDLPPAFDSNDNRIKAPSIKVFDEKLVGTAENINLYPNKFWLDNVAFEVVEIGIADPGEGYITAPIITIESESGSGAKALASLGPNGSISSVKLVSNGSNYLTLPKVVVNGSLKDNGRPAVLAARIGNSLIRSMHSVIKFDRVSGSFLITELDFSETFIGTGSKTEFDLEFPMDMRTNTIEITINGTAILSSQYTYENVLDTTVNYDRYFGRIKFLTPPGNAREIVVNYKKSIDLLTASDRINLFYNPTTGQIGKDINQLMDGVDYGGVQVKSYGFAGPQGWDSDNWYDNAWDLFDESFDEESFLLDGSTLTFQLSKPLAENVQYNLYINGIRIDDAEYDGTTNTSNLQNTRAIMASPEGDGVTTIVTIDNEIGYEEFIEKYGTDTNLLIIRRSTTDGSLQLNQESYDTSLGGGDLAYSTAKGLDANEITVDGDGFVTATTSKGPEEVIPGQVMDTLDINVYERPSEGSSLIYNTNHRGDGVTTDFAIEGIPFSFESMFVKVDYEILTERSDFIIDYNNKKIKFFTAPSNGAVIQLLSMGVSGTQVLDYDSFVADGTSSEFLTNVRWDNNRSAYVTVNGKNKPFELFESDSGYAVKGNVVIKFVEPPVANTKIQYALFDSKVQTFSQVTVDKLIADGSSTVYEISQAPFDQEPSAFYTIVTVNGKVLNPGYSQKFEVTSDREYQLKKWQVPVGSLSGDRIEVYLNGRKLSFLQEWTYEGSGAFDPNIADDAQPGSTIVLNRGVGVAGDSLTVYLMSDGEYRFGYFEIGEDSSDTFVQTPSSIHFDEVYADGSDIVVYQFSNHDSQGIERMNYDVIERTTMTPGTEGYSEFRQLKNGLIKLRAEAFDVSYVWVSLNGKWLIPTADYILTENKQYIKFVTPINDNDVVDIIQFANAPISNKFGWKIFKDMTNRYFFKRLEPGTIELAEDLRYYDKTITVNDGSLLTSPLAKSKIPGVIFIEGERIEYFGRDGNVLKQIRRGTLGTGVKSVYDAGTSVIRQSQESVIPYNEDTLEIVSTSGVYKDMSEEYSNSPLITFDNLTYTFNNNSAFPLGGLVNGAVLQEGVIKGSGFRSVAKVFVQDIECTTTFVSTTELRFVPPKLDVGAYDLVIYNPREESPIEIPSTALVVPKVVEYLQILLPFAPLPNPATEFNWYKETVDLPVTEIIPGRYYRVKSLGTTNWSEVGSSATIGYEFKATATGTGTGIVEDFSSIPYEYWEGMDIDMFISGRRLRKNPLTYFDPAIGQDSVNGNVTLEAEYAVNRAIGAYVRLTNPPEPNVKIIISKKTGYSWNEINNISNGPYKLNFKETVDYSKGEVVLYNGKFYEALQDILASSWDETKWKNVSIMSPLGKSDTQIAKFLRKTSIDLPR